MPATLDNQKDEMAPIQSRQPQAHTEKGPEVSKDQGRAQIPSSRPKEPTKVPLQLCPKVEAAPDF